MIIRLVTEGDIPDLAHIHVQGWQSSYGGIVDQNFLDTLDEADYRARWQGWLKTETFHALIAHDDNGKAMGFISFGKLKTPPPGSSPIRPPYSAEIFALYILPEFHRAGLGTALMSAAARALAALKHKSLCLWVLEKNVKGVAFYTKLGGQRIGKKDIEVGPTTAREVCYGWREAKVISQNQFTKSS